jgi:DNA end-binding protein Ku
MGVTGWWIGVDLGNAREMPRTIWKGSLNFGLVNVPVGVYPATQDKTIHFNQFESGTSDRIRYKKVNERTGQEVPGGDIVKGVDLGGGEYVILTDEELASAEPVRSKLIEITDFVDLDEIDPVYFRSTYYLAPEGDGANKAYALLRQVMRDANKIAIGTFVMRNKEYPVAIRPDDDVLKLETLYFSDEIRSPTKELPELPNATEVSKREVDMALLLLESMESEWDPARYHDTHRQKVEALIEEKRQGHDVLEGVEAGPKTNVVDLMEALSASVKSAKSSRSKAPAAKAKTDESTAPARRTAPKPAAKAATRSKTTKAAGAKKAAPKVAAQRKAS